jgi:2-keto-3-deoxy-L-rhamnonate aldolase RhmA
MSTSVIPPNRAKAALREGAFLLGTMVAEIRQPSIMQLLANAGFDFVVIDNEHGAFTVESIADLSRMARLVGLTPLVRVPDLAYPYLAQSLDGGVQGIMLPRVTHPDQVHLALDIMKYPPVGHRGCALGRGHTNFRGGPVAATMHAANDASMLWVQIETLDAMQHLEAIAAIPNVDALFVGPNDLSIAMGLPGQMDAPPVIEAIEQVMAACARHGVAAAIQANDIGYGTHWVEKGMQILSYGSEAALLVSAATAVITKLRDVRAAV